jgi:LmbE family N-acetylglucosaminyl deacetylase
MAVLVDPKPPASVLVIVAHPDDAEFSAGGTIARWVASGTEVDYCICTRGDKGTSDAGALPGEVATVREREQRAAAAVLGVRSVRFLGHPDGMLQNSLELRREIVAVIRELRPAAVICSDPLRRYGPTYVNHPDHRAAAEAALDAVFPSARDPLVFPELLRAGLEPHRVAEVFVSNPSEPSVAVDIATTLETKIAALREHASQVTEERLRTFIPQRAAEAGQPHGLGPVELFYRIELP